jgi:long-chain acyl-CoA synthetase
VRGDIVMKGYDGRPELTAQVIDKDGWLSTGDMALLTINGEIALRGRKKDTIVLRGGENVQPTPIEMRLNDSPFIKISVVVGQDQKSLGALIVPDKDEVLAFAEQKGIPPLPFPLLLMHPEVKKLFEQEIYGAINAKNGFRIFERIGPFALLSHDFEVGKELSAKQEIARYRIQEIYSREIRNMFK